MRDLAFLSAWLVLVPAGLISAPVGVMTWAWVALLSPNELLYGFAQSIPFNKVVTVVTAAGMIFGRGKKDFYVDRVLFLMLLLALVATVSWLGGIVPSDDADGLYQKLLKIIVLAYAIATLLTTREAIDSVVFAVVLALSFLGVKEGAIFLLTAGGHQIIGVGSIGDNNSLATALLMNLPLLNYLARNAAVRLLRIALLVVLGLSVVTVIATFSRGGFIGLLLLALLVVGGSRYKVRAAALILAVAVLVYAFAPASWFARVDTIGNADNDASFMGRVVAWKLSWLIAMSRPLFGGGPHAVQHLFVWQTFKPLLPTLDFIPTPPADDIPHAAHSSYFEILGDYGFLGLGMFLWILGTAIGNCRRIRRLVVGRPSLAWAGQLAHMLQISLIVYAVTTAALSMAYFEMFYILVALTSRCYRTVQQAVAAETGPAGYEFGRPRRTPATAVVRPAVAAGQAAGSR